MWFAEEHNEHFSEFGASVSSCFFNSNYMSICPVTEKQDHKSVCLCQWNGLFEKILENVQS